MKLKRFVGFVVIVLAALLLGALAARVRVDTMMIVRNR